MRRSKVLVAPLGATTAAALVLATAAVDARAQSSPEPAPSIEDCAAIESENERLACYDSVLRAQQEGAREERREPPQAARDAPAGPAPRAAAPASPPPRQLPQASMFEERAVIVVEVRMRPPLATVFTMEDGESWVQTDSRPIRHLDEAPFSARIQPGALGSFFLSPDSGGPRLRIRRVQ